MGGFNAALFCATIPAVRDRRALPAALLLGIAVKVALLATHSVPFNSDEAVLGLMARHIHAGARPVFFYGQAYMGSLDAYLVAGAFRVLGEGVAAIRAVQVGLYAGFILTLWLLARRLFHARAANYAALAASIPPVVVTTYTTATLGGYGETLLFGNLILLAGYEVVFGKWQARAAGWLALGFVGGLAFWTLGMAGVYLLPVALAGALRFRRARVPLYLLAGLAFLAGSAPWWVYNFSHGWAALQVLTLGAGDLPAPTTAGDRLLGLLLLGLPAVIGVRFPWEAGFAPPLLLFGGIVLFIGVTLFMIETFRRRLAPFAEGSGRLLSFFIAGFVLVFVGSRFGVDATGRYLLPLYVPFALAVGCAAAGRGDAAPAIWRVILLAALALNGAQTWRAAAAVDKITTQFDPVTRFDNSHDAALIAFLRAEGELTGYSNYWVTYRLAFLSGEEIIYAPALPYTLDLVVSPGDARYPPYTARAAAARRTAYITTLNAPLDDALRRQFAALGVTYRETEIGVYRVFHGLSRAVHPGDLDFLIGAGRAPNGFVIPNPFGARRINSARNPGDDWFEMVNAGIPRSARNDNPVHGGVP